MIFQVSGTRFRPVEEKCDALVEVDQVLVRRATAGAFAAADADYRTNRSPAQLLGYRFKGGELVQRLLCSCGESCQLALQFDIFLIDF